MYPKMFMVNPNEFDRKFIGTQLQELKVLAAADKLWEMYIKDGGIVSLNSDGSIRQDDKNDKIYITGPDGIEYVFGKSKA